LAKYRPTTKARANLTRAIGVEFLSFHKKPASQTRPESHDYSAVSLPPISSHRFRTRTAMAGSLAAKKDDKYREK
jgi:hypothetical protein